MIVLSLEEFTARRKPAFQRIEEVLRPVVEQTFDPLENTGGWDALLQTVTEQFREVYREESGEDRDTLPDGAREDITDTLDKTSDEPDETTVDRVTVWLATLILSLGTLKAAEDDPEELFMEWVDMGDSDVRTAHREAAGQQQPIGEMFTVGGHEMPYPGWPGVPIELWINCRCTLRPVLAEEALVASSDNRENKPTLPGEGDRFPIANVEDLKKAIKAYGRAKDEDKPRVKRWIKRRARELDAEGLLPESWSSEDAAFEAALIEAMTKPVEPFAKHDLIFLENRRTPKVVPEGQKYEPKESEGKIAKRRAATEEEERVIRRGDWVRVNEKGEKPGDSGYMKKKSKVRPQNNAGGAESFAQEELGEPTHAGMVVQAGDTGRILLLQRSLDPTDDPDVQGTWEFPGGKIEEGEDPQGAAWREWREETGLPMPEGEIVNGWRSEDGVYQGFVFLTPFEQEAFDDLNPDRADTRNPDDPQRRKPDVTAWFTVEQAQSLGRALRPEVAKMDWSVFRPGGKEYDVPDDEQTPDEEMAAIVASAEPEERRDDGPVPWHGVLTVEGIPSGDKRMFREGSVRWGDLPIPLTWQKTTAGGHDGSVTVAKIEKIERVGKEIRGSGHFLATVEADEVVGLIGEFGKYGVSIDADDASVEVNEDEGIVEFTDARGRSASIVSIPAFVEAYVSLGAAPEDFFTEEVDEAPEDALVAADFAKTEDGPGWLTHPVDTDRLRDYWVRGPGAAKIGWGAPGDFNRCRANLAKYVKPQYLAGYCANRHYDALGIWPGEHSSVSEMLEYTEPAEALNMIDALTADGSLKAPAEWFRDPGLEKITPLQITEEGRVFGHVADWSTCHVGHRDACVLPPHSARGYADFRLGAVLTTEGFVATGPLTIGGGHADIHLNAQEARAHYDSTSTAFADVACGEDAHGIWVAGWIRPGTPPEMVAAARGSSLSGDWRYVGGQRELVAAHAVNVPGFPIPRIAAREVGGVQMALVASGVVPPEKPASESPLDYALLAAAVADEIEGRARRREKMAALRGRFTEEN